MRRSVAFLSSLMLAGIAAHPGCGPDQFAPPPNLVVTPNTTTSAPAKSVYLVLPGRPDADSDALTWVLAGQSEAADRRAIFRVVGPKPGDSPGRQSELVREAIAEGASALVVVPQDPRALAPVLAEAESRKVPVVTLGGAEADDPPLPGLAVIPESFSDSAARLVGAVIEDARALGQPADPPAVILFAREGDRLSAARVASLQSAARKAGLSQLEMLGFEVKGQADGRTQAKLLLTEHLNKHPATTIVLAEGDEAMIAASFVRTQAKAERPIVVAGYIGFRGQTDPATLRANSAFVDGRLDILGRMAVRAALDKANGEKLASPLIVPTPFSRSIGQAIRDESPKPKAAPPARPPQP